MKGLLLNLAAAFLYVVSVDGQNATTNGTSWLGTRPTFNSSSMGVRTSTSIGNITSTLLSDVRSCDSRWDSYYSASISYRPSSYTTFLTTVADNYTITDISYTYTCETTCGTICYAGTKTALATSVEPHTQVYTLLTSTADPFPTPKPTCSVGLSDCLGLYSSYSSLSSEWSKARWATTSPPSGIPTSPVKPACNTCSKNRCTIDPMQVELYYFPTTSNVTRDMCASNPVGGPATRFPEYPNSTYVPITTGPYTILDGTTLHAGNVYVSIATASAHGGCGDTVGKVHYGSILTLASAEIQSMRGYPKNNIPWSFNFADFNRPVPYSAYYGIPSCGIRLPYCSVVFDDEYFPQLIMPAAVRQLDPAWSTCSLGFFGLGDPPIALQTLSHPLFPSSTSSSLPPAIPAETSAALPDPGGDPPVPGPTPSPPLPPKSSAGPDPGASSIPDPGPGPIPNPGPSSRSGIAPSASPGGTLPPGPGLTSVDPANPASSTSKPPSGPITITAGDQTLTVNPIGGIKGPSTTVAPGGNPITISGTTLSVGTNGVVVIDTSGTRTIPFSNPTVGPVLITDGPRTMTTDPNGNLILGPGTTLKPGDPAITISGTTISMGPSGVVIIDPAGTRTLTMTSASEVTLTLGGGEIVTATSANGKVVIGTFTLDLQHPIATLPGGQIVSLGPSGIVVGTTTGVSGTLVGSTTAVFSGPVATNTEGQNFTGKANERAPRMMGTALLAMIVWLVAI